MNMHETLIPIIGMYEILESEMCFHVECASILCCHPPVQLCITGSALCFVSVV